MNILQAWKLWGVASELEKEAVKENKMGTTVTPGWKTSEFWLHLLAYAPAVAAVILPQSSLVLLAITALSHMASSVYTAQRSGVKIAAMAPDAVQIAEAVAAALDRASKDAPAASDALANKEIPPAA